MPGAQFMPWLGVHVLQIVAMLTGVRLLDRHEREPLPLVLAAVVWGAVIALGLAAPINLLLLGRLPGSLELFDVAFVAPPVEEATKGLGLLILLWSTRWTVRRLGTREFVGITDGMVYGAAIGLGFGFLENVFFFVHFALGSGSEAVGVEVFLHRMDLFGAVGTAAMHAAGTATLGAAVGLAALQPARRRAVIVATGYGAAVLIHAVWNAFPTIALLRRFGGSTVHAWQAGTLDGAGAAVVQAAYWDAYGTMQLLYYGILAVLVLAFVQWQRHEGAIVSHELGDEPTLVSPAELAALLGWRSRNRWYLGLLRAGRWTVLRELRRHHHDLVEFALERWRSALSGAETDLGRRRTELQLQRAFVQQLAAVEPSPRPAAAAPVRPAAHEVST